MRRQPSARLIAIAAEHRAAPTFTEQKLWQHLRGSRTGVAFRRQVPIGRYVVDFLAPSIKLIVEVDGGYHSARRGADERRDAKLTRLGYQVLRMSAELVAKQEAVAIALVRAAVAGAR